MVRINQIEIEIFTNVTKLSSDIAIQKLKERDGNLVDALDAFYEGADETITQDTASNAPQNNVMGVDDPQSSNSVAIDENPLSLVQHFDMEKELLLAAIFDVSEEDMDVDLDLALAISSSFVTK